MLFKHILKTAYAGVRAHKSRSILTILGIVIGIAAIIAIVSIGREPRGPTDAAQVFSDSLKEKDLAGLRKKSNVPDINEVAPVIFGGESAAYENETYRLTIFGSSELITKIMDVQLAEGYFFGEDDIKNHADVAVIGSKVKDELFGSSQAIGEKIKIKNHNFKVIRS